MVKLSVRQQWMLLAADTPQGADAISFPRSTIDSLRKRGWISQRVRRSIHGFDGSKHKFVAIYFLTEAGRNALIEFRNQQPCSSVKAGKQKKTSPSTDRHS